jgi:non-homologous end joining protein Ku
MTTDLDDPPAPPRQRAYASNVRLTVFGVVTLAVDLVPQGRPNKRDETAASFVCTDDHEHPVRVSQRYVCPQAGLTEALHDLDIARTAPQLKTARDAVMLAAQHGPFREHDLARGRVHDGEMIVITAEDLAEAKTGGMEKNVAEFTPHPTEQVAMVCRPGGMGYRARLPKKHAKGEARTYATIVALVEAHPEVTFLAPMRLQDSRALYQLVVHRGQLMVSQVTHPADLADADAQDLEAPDERLTAMAEELLAGEVVDFDPDLYRHDAGLAVERLTAARAAGEQPDAAGDAGGDVLDLLAARLQQAKDKGGSRRRERTSA